MVIGSIWPIVVRLFFFFFFFFFISAGERGIIGRAVDVGCRSSQVILSANTKGRGSAPASTRCISHRDGGVGPASAGSCAAKC